MVDSHCRTVRWQHDIAHTIIHAFDHHQGFEGQGQTAYLLLDTITLGFVGSGTSESTSSFFFAIPSGLKNQDMMVENNKG